MIFVFVISKMTRGKTVLLSWEPLGILVESKEVGYCPPWGCSVGRRNRVTLLSFQRVENLGIMEYLLWIVA